MFKRYWWGILLRFILLTLFLLGFLLLEYYKSDYLFDLKSLTFVPNEGVNHSDFQTSYSGLTERILNSTKWLSHILLTVLYFLFTTCIIYLLFLSRQLARFTIIIYGGLIVISLVFLLIGTVMQSFHLAYEVNRFIKDSLIQSPLILVMMSAIAFGRRKTKS